MDSMEDKLGSILNDPKMMQQIMALAQSLGQSTETPQKQEPPRKQEAPASTFPEIDPVMLKSLSSMAGQGAIDSNQRTLLKALGPYLHQDRIFKLEKAMRAAKMARIASTFMNQGGFSFLSGR